MFARVITAQAGAEGFDKIIGLAEQQLPAAKAATVCGPPPPCSRRRGRPVPCSSIVTVRSGAKKPV